MQAAQKCMGWKVRAPTPHPTLHRWHTTDGSGQGAGAGAGGRPWAPKASGQALTCWSPARDTCGLTNAVSWRFNSKCFNRLPAPENPHLILSKCESYYQTTAKNHHLRILFNHQKHNRFFFFNVCWECWECICSNFAHSTLSFVEQTEWKCVKHTNATVMTCHRNDQGSWYAIVKAHQKICLVISHLYFSYLT